MTTRRSFLKNGSLAALGLIGMPRWMRVMDPTAPGTADEVRELAMRAIDAARQAGATYADVRLTRHLTEAFTLGDLRRQSEELAIGVRALVGGYWGFAASPYWDGEDAADLARNAVNQAKTYARTGTRRINWTPIPVATGAWATPIRIDPFTIPIEEKQDYFRAVMDLGRQYNRHVSTGTSAGFVRREEAVATTEGAYFTQTRYLAGGNYELRIIELRENGDQPTGAANATGLDTAGAGWELWTDADIASQLPSLYDRAEADLLAGPQPPATPGEVGRYTVVCDAATMATILAATIGTGSQLDRAVGDEANTGFTSYLGPDPMTFLGTAIASPLVTVRADRSMPKGLATAQWDAEGVRTEPFTIVDKGTLVDYQTTREQAEWLEPWYAKRGLPVRSHGCAAAASGLYTTMQHMPNLVLEPGRDEVSFDDLVASTPKGLAIVRGRIEPNFNGGQSLMRVPCREIVNGKMGRAAVTGIAALFGSVDFWKHLVALGGAASAQQVPWLGARKGEPTQSVPFSVRAVPAKITNVAFINDSRAAST